MSETLYASCAEVLSLCQSLKNDLAAILDPESGFAPRLRDICRQQLEDNEELGEQRLSLEEVEALRMESNTWGLLQAVMPARKTDPTPSPSPHTLLSQNPYTPTSTLAQAIMSSSPLLSELVVIREWLHETAPEPKHPEATTGYWKFTKYRVMQGLRMGRGGDGCVTEMDPDVGSRQEGKSLAGDDISYEKSLSQTLYAYVRAGRLDDAVELCRRAHQPWRAASIRGSLLFHWRAITDEQRDEDGMDEIDDGEGWRGNRRRKLWKSACTRAALNPTLSPQDRTLYASLSPSPSTSLILKSACKTWSDHLWAQISIMCEEKQSAEMSRLGATFWEDERSGVWEGGGGGWTKEEEEREEEEWEREVRGALEGLGGVGVIEGPPADHAFHISQLHIILDRTDALLESFAGGLKDGRYDVGSPEYPSMTRFFAHLCLFLQLIDVPVPPLAMQVILEAYLQVLESAGQRDLIALYAGALGDNAVERYAMFLSSLELDVDIGERKLALERAKEHGLDRERVGVGAAERSVERALEALPQNKGPLPSVIGFQSGPSDGELFLLRSIEWTTFFEGTFGFALEQANVILRYFLAAGRVQVAKMLLDALPPDLASITEPPEQATEYLGYRQFFNVWEMVERVVECQALEVQHMSKETRIAWLKDYKMLVEQAYEMIVKLLTTDWLVPDGEDLGDRRIRELVRIRQIYIPELIIRLHSMLFASRTKFPENLKRTLELANVVADSRYALYDDFTNQDGKRLGDYLGGVRAAVLGGLEGGGSDPFRVLNVL